LIGSDASLSYHWSEDEVDDDWTVRSFGDAEFSDGEDDDDRVEQDDDDWLFGDEEEDGDENDDRRSTPSYYDYDNSPRSSAAGEEFADVGYGVDDLEEEDVQFSDNDLVQFN
jgi:hypothetical protein